MFKRHPFKPIRCKVLVKFHPLCIRLHIFFHVKKLKKSAVPLEQLAHGAHLRGLEQYQENALSLIPAVCPACGGSFRSDEVDWINHSQIECSWYSVQYELYLF